MTEPPIRQQDPVQRCLNFKTTALDQILHSGIRLSLCVASVGLRIEYCQRSADRLPHSKNCLCPLQTGDKKGKVRVTRHFGRPVKEMRVASRSLRTAGVWPILERY